MKQMMFWWAVCKFCLTAFIALFWQISPQIDREFCSAPVHKTKIAPYWPYTWINKAAINKNMKRISAILRKNKAATKLHYLFYMWSNCIVCRCTWSRLSLYFLCSCIHCLPIANTPKLLSPELRVRMLFIYLSWLSTSCVVFHLYFYILVFNLQFPHCLYVSF